MAGYRRASRETPHENEFDVTKNPDILTCFLATNRDESLSAPEKVWQSMHILDNY